MALALACCVKQLKKEDVMKRTVPIPSGQIPPVIHLYGLEMSLDTLSCSSLKTIFQGGSN